ncbi:MAG: alkyl sulfatase dimerization domain-containing protein, partial [Thiohalobacterales bacterium]|nr:alkyl sulfatase dimerization domain-containing protein [Thiohalobacterales bacterium]
MKMKQFFASALCAAFAFSAGLALAGQDVKLDTKDVRAGGTPVGDLIRVPIERRAITDNVFHVSGLANVYAVNTPEGAIVIDTGFAHQAPRQMELLREVIQGPVRYIFLPQGQHDDVGGIPLISDDETRIIMTRASAEYMEYRKRAGAYLAPRYAALYSWANELRDKGASNTKKTQKKPFPYNPITPDVLVEDHIGHKFELGGIKFEVIALPGAEGINSAGLWMPEERILFAGGGSVGPEIPMWPNIGTVRADRNRLLDEYIDTINTIIDLKPAVLLPGQDDPMTDEAEIMESLVLLRDASTYVYDEIWKGLSAGKDVYQLMREIRLPEHLDHLSQQHGRVEWTVRETVNQTGGWFAYRYTSELYPYRPHAIYPTLVALSGEAKVVAAARDMLAAGELEQAMMMAEAVVAADG